MASKRILKKHINYMIFDVVEECFTVQAFNPKKVDDADKLIDDAAEFQDSILSEINKAKSKKEFSAIITKIESKHEEFVKGLNDLN
ncbi:MAG: hypothetical protein ACI9XP_001548 [Lentimonas sp.]|jgi:hypothetical protein